MQLRSFSLSPSSILPIKSPIIICRSRPWTVFGSWAVVSFKILLASAIMGDGSTAPAWGCGVAGLGGATAGWAFGSTAIETPKENGIRELGRRRLPNEHDNKKSQTKMQLS